MGYADNNGYTCALCGFPKTKFTDGLSIIEGKWYCDRCAREIEGSMLPSPFKTAKYGCPDRRYWGLESCDGCPKLILKSCTAGGVVKLREKSSLVELKEVDVDDN